MHASAHTQTHTHTHTSTPNKLSQHTHVTAVRPNMTSHANQHLKSKAARSQRDWRETYPSNREGPGGGGGADGN